MNTSTSIVRSLPLFAWTVNQFRVGAHALRQIVCMNPSQAYQYGQAITDVRQAARQLRKKLLTDPDSGAWFALGFWRIARPSKVQVDQTVAALGEHCAYVVYEGFRQSADAAWVEWLLYAPIAEQRRQVPNH